MLESFSQDDMDRVNTQSNRGVITAMIDEDQRRARLRGNKDVGKVGLNNAGFGPVDGKEVQELRDQVKRLEKDMAELKGLIKGSAGK